MVRYLLVPTCCSVPGHGVPIELLMVDRIVTDHLQTERRLVGPGEVKIILQLLVKWREFIINCCLLIS